MARKIRIELPKPRDPNRETMRTRKPGAMKDRREGRGGARNWRRDLEDEAEEELEEELEEEAVTKSDRQFNKNLDIYINKAAFGACAINLDIGSPLPDSGKDEVDYVNDTPERLLEVASRCLYELSRVNDY